MNYTKLFYWLVVADNAKTLFMWGIIIFTIIAVISIIINFIARASSKDSSLSEKEKNSAEATADYVAKWMMWSIPFAIFFWSLYIFTPSKKDSLLIVAGGSTLNFLTTDSTSKQLPHELSSYLVTEIRNMAEETKVELSINDNKQKVLEEAKNLTGAELIEKLKSDTTLRDMILK